MFKLKRMLGSVLLVLILFSLPILSSEKKPISFTIFYHFTPQEDRGVAFRKLINEFNKKYAGVIEVKLSFFADWQPLQQKIRTMVAAGTPPDVFYFNFNPNDLSLFESGQLMDFKPYMDFKWKQRFYSEDLESLTYKGKLLAIPIEQGTVVFYYNKKLFEKAGLKSFPKTWDEFFETCEKLKKAGITPLSLFTADDAWHATNYFTYLAAELGGPNVFSPGKSLNTPEIIKAAEYLKKLFEYTTPNAVGGKWALSVQNFITGETAILLDGPWVIGMIDKQMPDPNDVEVAEPPTFREGEKYILVTDAVTAWAASNKLSRDQKNAVVTFLKWFTSEEISKRFIIEGNFSFAVKVNFTKEDKKKMNPKFAANFDIAQKASKKVVQVTRVLKPRAMNELPRLIESLATGQLSPSEFAETLDKLNR